MSEANAIANLDAEAPGWDFDAKRTAAAAAWHDALGAVEIEAAEPVRKMLYTSLYHALMAPSIFMDVDGSYRGPDHEIHHAAGFTFRSTFSLWDTYRALHPLLTLVRPESDNVDFVRSLVASWQQSPDGVLPVWQFQGQETWTMIGYHAVPVIADNWLKGIKGDPPQLALDAMVASATNPRYAGLDEYMKLGWVASDKEREGASKTLEYAFDDWTIARTAASMGRADIAKQFDERARNWRNVFDPKTGFIRARKSDGKFRDPFNPALRVTTAITPRVMRGSTHGTYRRTRPASSGPWAGTNGLSPSSIPCLIPRSTQSSSRTSKTSRGSSATTRMGTSRATTSATCTSTPGNRGGLRSV